MNRAAKREVLETYMQPSLDFGESIEAILSLAEVPRDVVGWGGGDSGRVEPADHRAIVVTNHTVYVLDVSRFGKPKEVLDRAPRSEVIVGGYGRQGWEFGWKSLWLGPRAGGMYGAGREMSKRVRVSRSYQSEARAVVDALG